MSHELRTPLNAILGFAQLMESGAPPPSPSQKRNLDQILKAGWYLLDLINEILDLALIESGKMTLSAEPVSLAEVMLECRAMIEPQAQKRGLAMTFPRFEIPYFVKADRTRVKQVLINLLFNAIKYNKPGGTVAVESALAPLDSIRISVRDSGAGLAPEQLAQLFQPFNRLGKEAGAEEGTGIGLVVTKKLVELMPASAAAALSCDRAGTTKVKSALLADPDVKSFDLKVETNKGEVMLSGFVDNQTQMDRAIQVASGVQGVKAVSNKMGLKEGAVTVGDKLDDGIITTKVKSALLSDPDIKSFDIAVVTRNGEVQLSGFVSSQTQIDHAIELTRAVDGVRSVANEMSVKK